MESKIRAGTPAISLPAKPPKVKAASNQPLKIESTTNTTSEKDTLQHTYTTQPPANIDSATLCNCALCSNSFNVYDEWPSQKVCNTCAANIWEHTYLRNWLTQNIYKSIAESIFGHDFSGAEWNCTDNFTLDSSKLEEFEKHVSNAKDWERQVCTELIENLKKQQARAIKIHTSESISSTWCFFFVQYFFVLMIF